MAAPEEQLLSLEDVASRLQVSDQTVRRWIKSGKLAAYKPGLEWRIKPSDLEEFLQARSSPKGRRSSPLEPTFNGLLEEERRIDFTNLARAVDAFSFYWDRAIRVEERRLDRDGLRDFLEAVRVIVLTLREVRPVADAEDQQVMKPSIQRFVVVANAVATLAEDAAAPEVAELVGVLQELAA